MSAKGRREGGSIPFDYYPTPAWCVWRLLDDCGDELFAGEGVEALEPTIGDGAIVRAAMLWIGDRRIRPDPFDRRPAPGAPPQPRWTGVELRRGALRSLRIDQHHEGEDFRTWEAPCRYQVAIGNPPFSLAEAILRRALELSDRCAFLLRLGFLGAAERVPFWREHPDVAVRVLPDRPSFDGVATDSATYAWFIWGCPAVTGVRVLEPTPASVRRAHQPGRPVGVLGQTALALGAAE